MINTTSTNPSPEAIQRDWSYIEAIHTPLFFDPYGQGSSKNAQSTNLAKEKLAIAYGKHGYTHIKDILNNDKEIMTLQQFKIRPLAGLCLSCSFFLTEVANFSSFLLILDVASPPATALTHFFLHQCSPQCGWAPLFCQSLDRVFVRCLSCFVWFVWVLNPSLPSLRLFLPLSPLLPLFSHPGPHIRSSCPSVPLG